MVEDAFGRAQKMHMASGFARGRKRFGANRTLACE
ncbi:hypothetical protein BPC006_I4102 [Burkholderia pseudomallei BPC006]|nr:hypothetical protein BPC006_I4102 [Burkholderia pseudomallei BPC006]